MNDRLYRSRDERILTGVAGGVAERFDLDPSLVRVGWVVLAILSGGLFLLLYIVMVFVVPEAPADWDAVSARTFAPGPGAVPGWGPAVGDVAAARPQTGAAGAGPDSMAFAASSSEAGSAFPTPDAPGPSSPGGVSPQPPLSPSPAPGGPQPAPTGWAQAPSGPPPARRARSNRRGGSLLAGIILVLLGGYFLLRQLVPELELGALWPSFLVIVGVALVILAFRPTRT